MLPLGIYEKALPFDLSWGERLELAREIGFDFVELSIDESDERIRRLEASSKERRDIYQAIQETGVLLKTLCLSAHRKYPLGSASLETQRQSHELFARAIDLAVELGVRIIQVAGYYVYYEEETADCIRCYEEGLAKGLKLAAQAGVMLAIENMDTLGVCSLKEGMRLVNKIDSPWLQLYPDIGNLTERSCDSLVELEAAKGHMVALHVKDARPGEPRRVPFGEGEVDFVAAFERLAQLGFNGPVLVEMWNDNAPDSLQKVKDARAFVLKRMAEGGLIEKVETVR